MLRVFFKLCVVFSFIFPCLMSNGRKYDVETEALKLYGEDFKSVLRRFRKTPDYLKILNDKMNDLKVYVKEMSLQLLHYHHGKMTQRVNDMVGVTRNYNEETATAPGSQQPVYFRASGGRRQDSEESAVPGEPSGAGEPEQINHKGIKKLDEYKAFSYALGVSERNSFKDLGFEFAGNLIHSIIHNMGPVEAQPKSTRQPFGGDSDKIPSTNSEHPHTHEVTAESTVGPKEDDHTPEQTTETFRFRYRPHP